MTEAERRERYDTRRVLIETDRILNPQLAAGAIFLSAAQVELLRNVVQYLDRRSTFVDEYSLLSYLTPTVAEWDDVRSVVADLEEKLMGNENTIWGYNDVYGEKLEELPLTAGVSTKYSETVPEGEVWTVEGCAAMVGSATVTQLLLGGYVGGEQLILYAVEPPVNREYYVLHPTIRLIEDDRLYVQVAGATAGDTLIMSWWGYKMVVPVRS